MLHLMFLIQIISFNEFCLTVTDFGKSTPLKSTSHVTLATVAFMYIVEFEFNIVSSESHVANYK